MMDCSSFLHCVPILFLLISLTLVSVPLTAGSTGTILFSTLGRCRYNFDIFSLPISSSSSQYPNVDELQLTDGVSVNYNGFFSSNSSLLYVSERNGAFNVYLDSYQSPIPFSFPLLGPPANSMKDRPSITREHLIYVSTHEPSPFSRQSWAAVYSTHLPTSRTRRLTPHGVADFSPSVSPSGLWTAVASSGERGWSGEIQGLKTSIYVFSTADGSMRTELIENGGWSCWADDDTTLYFHRQSQEDGWWSVYRARIEIKTSGPAVNSVERVTPPGFHAFTPAASVGSPGIIAVATRRSNSKFRHIELVDVKRNAYVEVTRPVSPNAHHYNPFISPDGTRIGYHRCRGGDRRRNGSPPLLFESMEHPFQEKFSLIRIDGLFPSSSHDGRWIAYAGWENNLYVIKADGSGSPRKVLDGAFFANGWDWKRKGVLYTSVGPTFASEATRVDIISVAVDDDDHEPSEPLVKRLTTGGENNAFPSASPDGKWVVFRSGRSGHKNLYIMDAVEGESGGIYQLTEGPWSDTMPNWSPDGDWIAFSSDRDSPGSGSFSIYMVHPNGTGLRKVVQSGDGGRANHPWFSPDSKSFVFTSDYAAVSAEPISTTNHFQPYGEIFVANIDGSDIRRLTHNSYEDGTPVWSPFFVKPVDVAEHLQASSQCGFGDCAWLNVYSDGVNNSILARNRC